MNDNLSYKLRKDLDWLVAYWYSDEDTKIKMLFTNKENIYMAKLYVNNSPRIIKVIEEIETYNLL